MTDLIEAPEATTDIVTFNLASMTEKVSALVILTDADEAAATEGQRTIKARIDDIKAEDKPHIENAHKAHIGLTQALKAKVAPLEGLIDLIRGKLVAYQDVKRKEAMRLQVIAIEKAKKDADDMKLLEAGLHEAMGDKEAAIAVLETPTVVVVPLVKEAKVAGVSYSDHWTAELVDKAAFIRHVGANADQLTYLECIAFSLKGLNDLASQVKDTCVIPGLTITKKQRQTLRG